MRYFTLKQNFQFLSLHDPQKDVSIEYIAYNAFKKLAIDVRRTERNSTNVTMWFVLFASFMMLFEFGFRCRYITSSSAIDLHPWASVIAEFLALFTDLHFTWPSIGTKVAAIWPHVAPLSTANGNQRSRQSHCHIPLRETRLRML